MSFPVVMRTLSLALAAGVLLAACGGAAEPTATAPAATAAAATTAASPAATGTAPTAETPAGNPTGNPAATQPAATPTAEDTETPAPVTPGPLDPAAYTFVQAAAGFDEPVLVTHAGDGSGRLFVLEQTGRIRIAQDGQALPEPFLDVSSLITTQGLEQGLLGLAFHPSYAGNGYFFIDYTDTNGDTVVARYTVSADDPNRADPNSGQIVLTQDQPYPNHNGGHLAFGPDGFLYIALGDGGAGGDPEGNAQNLGTLLGKLLRVNVDADGFPAAEGNPFVGTAGARPEIWAYGLRNPWRFSFDRATGDLYIGDVGQNAWEEIDFQPASSRGGEDYGWDFFEGNHPFEGQPPADAKLVPPVAEYAQEAGGCAVTGGHVYRGPSLPELHGIYFYGDYCTGIMWTLARDSAGAWQSQQFAVTDYAISSFGEDEAGELYLADRNGGAVYRLAHK